MSMVVALVDEMDFTSGSFYSNGGMQLQTYESNNPLVTMVGSMESKVHSYINALYTQIDKMEASVQVTISCFIYLFK